MTKRYRRTEEGSRIRGRTRRGKYYLLGGKEETELKGEVTVLELARKSQRIRSKWGKDVSSSSCGIS